MERDPYRRIANWYDRVLEPMNAPLQAIGLKMHPVEPDAGVLDVGCGTGSYLARYLEVGCRAFGIDASPAMLDQAERRLEGRADLRLGDATRLPYDDDSFDLVLATMFLHELDPPVRETALSEMARVVKPDGRVLVIDFSKGRLRGKGLVSRGLSLAAEMAAGRTHFRNFRAFMRSGGLPPLLGPTGLTVQQERTVSGGNLAVSLLRPPTGSGDR
jgi:ubiquinone/menaquinone biosynthesis C-methylase UbiE